MDMGRLIWDRNVLPEIRDGFHPIIVRLRAKQHEPYSDTSKVWEFFDLERRTSIAYCLVEGCMMQHKINTEVNFGAARSPLFRHLRNAHNISSELIMDYHGAAHGEEAEQEAEIGPDIEPVREVQTQGAQSSPTRGPINDLPPPIQPPRYGPQQQRRPHDVPVTQFQLNLPNQIQRNNTPSNAQDTAAIDFERMIGRQLVSRYRVQSNQRGRRVPDITEIYNQIRMLNFNQPPNTERNPDININGAPNQPQLGVPPPMPPLEAVGFNNESIIAGNLANHQRRIAVNETNARDESPRRQDTPARQEPHEFQEDEEDEEGEEDEEDEGYEEDGEGEEEDGEETPWVYRPPKTEITDENRFIIHLVDLIQNGLVSEGILADDFRFGLFVNTVIALGGFEDLAEAEPGVLSQLRTDVRNGLFIEQYLILHEEAIDNDGMASGSE